MSAKLPDHVVENILAAVAESQRLKLLSNEDLCREYIKLNTAGEDDELHGNEMMNRLWPEWANEEDL